MKKLVMTFFILFCVLVFYSSCSSQNGNLPIATYEDENQQRIIFQDKSFVQVGKALDPDKKLKNKKIGGAENLKSDSALFIYSISGYDENDFLFVEELEENMLNTGYYKELKFYVSIDVDNIPYKFVYMNMLRGAEISYEQKKYNYYSKAPSGFELGDKLGETNDKFGTAISIYSIPGHVNGGWIAVKEKENNDIIRLFWTDSIDSVPMEYLEFPQKYPDSDYAQKIIN